MNNNYSTAFVGFLSDIQKPERITLEKPVKAFTAGTVKGTTVRPKVSIVFELLMEQLFDGDLNHPLRSQINIERLLKYREVLGV